MKNKQTHQPAALKGAGKQDEIAKAWIAFTINQNSAQAQNCFAAILDWQLREKLPLNSYGGILLGQEEEVRQTAALLLLRHYLSGNAALVQAAEKGDTEEVRDQLDRSIKAALKFCQLRRVRQLIRDQTGRSPMPEDDLCGSNDHPSNYAFENLSFPLRKELALDLLRQGVERRQLKEKNAAIVTAIIERGITQAEIADEMKISRQAVHQQIAPVRKFLRQSIENQEFPLL